MSKQLLVFIVLSVLVEVSFCSDKVYQNTNVNVTDLAIKGDESEGRGCPNCVSGECGANTVVSGLPIVQLIAAGIVGFIWAAIFIWLYASFYQTSYSSGSSGYGYGPSPSYGYGKSPTYSYGPPKQQYGVPLSTYNAPAPAPLYNDPGPAPAYMSPPPAPAYMAPAQEYMAPVQYMAPAYNPAPVYQAPAPPAPVYKAPSTSYGVPSQSYMAPSSDYNPPSSGDGLNNVLKPPSRSSFNSRGFDSIAEDWSRALNSTSDYQ